MLKKETITNNKDLMNTLQDYQGWSKDNNQARWMVVCTIKGVPYQFFTNNRESASIILNEITSKVDRRFFKRLFLSSKGEEYSLEFFRIARGTQGGKVLRVVA